MPKQENLNKQISFRLDDAAISRLQALCKSDETPSTLVKRHLRETLLSDSVVDARRVELLHQLRKGNESDWEISQRLLNLCLDAIHSASDKHPLSQVYDMLLSLARQGHPETILVGHYNNDVRSDVITKKDDVTHQDTDVIPKSTDVTNDVTKGVNDITPPVNDVTAINADVSNVSCDVITDVTPAIRDVTKQHNDVTKQAPGGEVLPGK